MSIQKIPSIGLFSISSGPDNEHLEIMRRLRAYGVTPTGDKTTDKNKLREIELKKAKEENTVTNKFLTVSTSEQEKIQEEVIKDIIDKLEKMISEALTTPSSSFIFSNPKIASSILLSDISDGFISRKALIAISRKISIKFFSLFSIAFIILFM